MKKQLKVLIKTLLKKYKIKKLINGQFDSINTPLILQNIVLTGGNSFKIKGQTSYFNFNEHFFLLEGFNYLRSLLADGFNLSIENEKIIISNQTFSFNIFTSEEIFILHEIFHLNMYNFSLSHNSVVIDIGMNVGFGSLYFASKPGIEKVLSYEIFPETYKLAMQNIDLNPMLAYKIESYNIGVSDRKEEFELDYHPQYKGLLGLNTSKENLTKRFGDKIKEGFKKQKVSVEEFDYIINNVVVEFPGRDIIVKMDCEGCEYTLFKISKEIKKVKTFVVEWHFDGPDVIIKILSDIGFTCFSLYKNGSNDGMIYAVK